MFARIERRRKIARQAETEARTLIAEHGAGAYVEARRRERDAVGSEDAVRWRRAAIVNAKRTGRRIGLDTATRMAANADMSAKAEVTTPSRPAAPLHEIDPLAEVAATIMHGERRDR